MQEELNNILQFLKNVQHNNDFGNDNNKIKHLYDELSNIQNNLFSEEILEEIQKLELDLEIKHDCLNELSYYFDPLYIKIKKYVHKQKINKIRQEIKSKRLFNTKGK